jgi:chorismate mutase
MTLDALRQSIDRIDDDIVRLLNERARVAVEIGREKRAQGVPVVDAAREDEVLGRARRRNQGPMSQAAMESLYRSIVRECSRLQEQG